MHTSNDSHDHTSEQFWEYTRLRNHLDVCDKQIKHRSRSRYGRILHRTSTPNSDSVNVAIMLKLMQVFSCLAKKIQNLTRKRS